MEFLVLVLEHGEQIWEDVETNCLGQAITLTSRDTNQATIPIKFQEESKND